MVEPNCVFCKIIAGDLPARRIYEDDHAIAFLDLQPWHRGHSLVVPRQHVESLVSGAPKLAEIGPAIDTCARLLTDRLAADGINLVSSAGSVAGQEVFHLHVHLIPRYAAAPGVANLIKPRTVDAEELDAVLEQITGS